MPETLQAPPEAAQVKLKLKEYKIGDWNWKDRQGISVLEDEYNPNRQIPILKPLGLDTERFDFGNSKEEYNFALGEQYEYYSKTRELEYGSERTDILEGIVNKMTAGENLNTRVVIMNKGGVTAFVHVDGTIFISQSLLNQLDTLDQVAAVLGHELGHLVHKTHSRVAMARNEAVKFGVEALHERVSDSESRFRLEKAGFNSLEFSSMINLIQGIESDYSHGSGLSRSAANFGSHFLLDSRTADLEVTPIPEFLHKDFKNTNLEVATNLSGKAPTEEITEIINKLHPQDLESIYPLVWKYRNVHPDRIEVVQELILNRLMEADYSKLDSMMMLVLDLATWPNDFKAGTGELNDLKVLQEVVDRLEFFEKNDMVNKMHKAVFSSNGFVDSSTIRFIRFLNIHMYDNNISENKKGVPVTNDSLIDILGKTSDIRTLNEQEKEVETSNLIVNYIRMVYISIDENGKRVVDVEGVRSFFEQVKDHNIKFNKDTLRGAFYNRPRLREADDRDGLNVQILQIYSEVFNIDISETFEFGNIDNFFNKLELGAREGKNISAGELIEELAKHFDDYGISDAERVKFLDYIDQKINGLDIKSQINFWEYLNGNKNWKDATEDRLETLKSDLMKFQLKIVFGRTTFAQEGEEFYGYIEKTLQNMYVTMQQAGLDPKELSKVQLINLCQGLLVSSSWNKSDSLIQYGPETEDWNDGDYVYITPVSDNDRFFNLPFIREAVQMEEQMEAENILDLKTYASMYFERLHTEEVFDRYSLYQDSPLSLLIGPVITRRFNDILEKGIPIGEFDSLFRFVNRYFPEGVQRSEILRSVNRQYLSSKEISFDDKVHHLKLNLENIGYEGVLMVMEDIVDINTYRNFKKDMGSYLNKYLDGSATVTKIALVDALSTELVKGFSELLGTAQEDSKSKKSVSTNLANKWIGMVFGNSTTWDQASGKFILNEKSRGVFRSLTDVFTQFRNFSSLQRFAVAQKALLEENGALANEANREKLAQALISAIKLKIGFISEVLQTAIRIAPADYIGFPTSNMLGSLLFRAFDVNSVDISDVQTQRVYREGEYVDFVKAHPDIDLRRILESGTRDIVLFSPSSRKDPNSKVAQIADESDRLYYETVDRFKALTGEQTSIIEEEVKGYKIDPSMEAIIRGVESSGALGIRALQLSSQFHTFSPDLNKRLSETFDSYKSMDRLFFWENLDKLIRDDPNGAETKKLEEFLQRIKLGRFLGGGSLQTTYAAIMIDEDGLESQIIIKRKNPSVAGLLGVAYETSHKVLEEVGKNRDKETQEYAKLGIVLIDLSQNWCLADLKDASYIRDDDTFRQTIDKYNIAIGRDVWYAPERVFTQVAVKSEDLAKGDTVNRLLNDPNVPTPVKKQLVTMLGQFFAYQMRGNSFTDEDGKRFFLIHSDPHIGNYVADIENPKQPRVAVIDRSMYLKLSEKEVEVLGKLSDGSPPNDFIWSFIDLVLDANKDINKMERMKTRARVFKNVATEFARQVVQGRVNKFLLLTPILKDLNDQGKDIPLRVRLMIRNIAAFQELSKRYGVDFEALYKQAA